MRWFHRVTPGEELPPGTKRVEDHPLALAVLVVVVFGVPVLLSLVIGAALNGGISLVELLIVVLPALVIGAFLWLALRRMSRRRRSGSSG